MHNIFTYGSLMFAPVWSRVVKGIYPHISAKLAGYQRLAVKDEEYPVIIPAPAHHVEGILYLNVDATDLGQLDAFEGEYYARIGVTVDTANGLLNAQVYVLKPEYRHIATEQPWDVRYFRDHGILRFMNQYQGFNSAQETGNQ